MVPRAAVLVIGDEDDRIRPVRAVFHGADDIGDMLLTFREGSITRVFVIFAKRFDIGDGREIVSRQGREEIFLVLEVRRFGGRTISIIGIEGEGLVMILKERIGVASESIVPASGVPGPGDIFAAEAITNSGGRLLRNELGRIGD